MTSRDLLRRLSGGLVPASALILIAAQGEAPRSAATPPPPQAGTAGPCAESLVDQAGGPCLQASSVPTPGLLFSPPHDGGENNAASGGLSFIGGGKDNTASAYYSTVAGGFGNTASAYYSTVGGGTCNRALGRDACVSGGAYGYAAAQGSTVSGGVYNVATGVGATVGGGWLNSAYGAQSVIGGGNSNLAAGFRTAIVGGSDNEGTSSYTFLGGGLQNTASGPHATVPGGIENRASGSDSVVGGGRSNQATGGGSTVPGGRQNLAAGQGSLAAGFRASADHSGSFVWGDSIDADKRSSRADEFNVYASGGARIFSDEFAATGVKLRPGGGSWSTVSDRATKENVEPVDAADVLQHLLAMPVSTWNYRTQTDDIRHMGPMAQDFHAAFGLGGSDVLIDTVDLDGVALAAIQGLAGELAERDAELSRLQASVDELRAELARIERPEDGARARARDGTGTGTGTGTGSGTGSGTGTGTGAREVVASDGGG